MWPHWLTAHPLFGYLLPFVFEIQRKKLGRAPPPPPPAFEGPTLPRPLPLPQTYPAQARGERLRPQLLLPHQRPPPDDPPPPPAPTLGVRRPP
ncbi:hypothetical protein BDA96_10G146400 [Sorghum bicolor]|uniref:Uncharacterized protein n=1 Tax=Sorghum bicolor TaxID=4558 RepID=A0A921U0T2_SORBI|nr:hypothetical protein BDA96_10G146400 [Sorghum bicolor]